MQIALVVLCFMEKTPKLVGWLLGFGRGKKLL
jgi:hypothetical protein